MAVERREFVCSQGLKFTGIGLHAETELITLQLNLVFCDLMD